MKITLLNKMVGFCFLLLALRVIRTGHFSFIFLIWNLFLAWIPLLIAKKIESSDKRYKRFVMLGLSVLFLPNAPYILTDLFHLKKHLVAPMWFDLVLILSFAFLGLVYFILAVELIIKELNAHCSKRLSAILKPLLFLASGYGIYLGRYLRFNSWDLVSNPVGLADGICNSLFDPGRFIHAGAVTITFTIFLYLIFEIYLSFKHQCSVKDHELH